MVERMREMKDAGELETMREAARIGSEVMAEVLQLARPGVTELELAAEIDYRMRRKGAPVLRSIPSWPRDLALPCLTPSLPRSACRKTSWSCLTWVLYSATTAAI